MYTRVCLLCTRKREMNFLKKLGKDFKKILGVVGIDPEILGVVGIDPEILGVFRAREVLSVCTGRRGIK